MKKLISENIKIINENIERACIKANKNPKDINIIGVTKNVGVCEINILKSLGISSFGENKTKELLSKYNEIEDASWHFIGNLQTNKVKHIIDKVDIIQSVNSERLLREIDKRAGVIERRIPIFLELNIAKEASKCGLMPEELNDMIGIVK